MPRILESPELGLTNLKWLTLPSDRQREFPSSEVEHLRRQGGGRWRRRWRRWRGWQRRRRRGERGNWLRWCRSHDRRWLRLGGWGWRGDDADPVLLPLLLRLLPLLPWLFIRPRLRVRAPWRIHRGRWRRRRRPRLLVQLHLGRLDLSLRRLPHRPGGLQRVMPGQARHVGDTDPDDRNDYPQEHREKPTLHMVHPAILRPDRRRRQGSEGHLWNIRTVHRPGRRLLSGERASRRRNPARAGPGRSCCAPSGARRA